MTKNKTTTTPANSPSKTASPADKAPPQAVVDNETGAYPSLTEIKELIEFVAKKEFNDFELELGAFRLRWQKGPAESAAPANLQRPALENRHVELASAPLAAPQPV